jgi:hypothetical protein
MVHHHGHLQQIDQLDNMEACGPNLGATPSEQPSAQSTHQQSNHTPQWEKDQSTSNTASR